MESLINFVPLFEKFNQTLIIVDVQEGFAEWWDKNGKDSLPERINDICPNYDNVIQIWDDHKANDASWEFYGQSKKLRKHFGVDSKDGEIHDYSAIFRPEDINKAMELGKKDNIATPSIFKTIDGNYIIRVVGGTHKWFKVSKELYDSLSSITNSIVLVGGAEGECLKDVQNLLDILGKTHTCDYNYCYNASDENDDFYKEIDAKREKEESEQKAQPIPLKKDI